jgi:hypothetical protein
MSTGGARVGGAGGAVAARRDAGRRGIGVRGSKAASASHRHQPRPARSSPCDAQHRRGRLGGGALHAAQAPPSQPSPAGGGRRQARFGARCSPYRHQQRPARSSPCDAQHRRGRLGGGAFAGRASAPIPAFPRRRGKETSALCRQMQLVPSPATPGLLLPLRCAASQGEVGRGCLLCRSCKRPHPSLPPRAGEGDGGRVRHAAQLPAFPRARGKETSEVRCQMQPVPSPATPGLLLPLRCAASQGEVGRGLLQAPPSQPSPAGGGRRQARYLPGCPQRRGKPQSIKSRQASSDMTAPHRPTPP